MKESNTKDENEFEKNFDIKHLLDIILIAIAVIIIVLSFISGSHKVASILSLGGLVLILIVEGLRLVSSNYHSKHIMQVHDKLDKIETLIKNNKKL